MRNVIDAAMNSRPLESDWKLYRARIDGWRDRYLEQKNKEIAAILTNKQETPTGQFWDTKEKIDEVARILIDCFDAYSRSTMEMHLLSMLDFGVIRDSDLTEFSEELCERVRRIFNRSLQ